MAILSGIIHEVLSSKQMKPVMYQFYDYLQMFDSIDLKEVIIDLSSKQINKYGS